MFKKAMCIILSLVFVCSVALFAVPVTTFAEENTIEFSGGDGSEGNPYKVATAAHLNNVRDYLTSHFIQIADIDLTAATAIGGDYFNNGQGWKPIGEDLDSGYPFSGTYNGDGHIILGMKIDIAGEAVGLFGYSEGTIKNLGMVDGNVRNYAFSYAYAYVGGIVGYNDGTMYNCYNSSSVSSSAIFTGGVTGINRGTMNNCYNSGSVSSSAAFTGGVAGISDGIISNCYNTATVSAEYTVMPSSSVGGIAGANSGTLITCYNIGSSFSSIFDSSSTAGGITGANPGGVIANCYTINTGYSGDYGTILTLEQMKLQQSFVGFDFDDVWSINSNKNNGLPYLNGMIKNPAKILSYDGTTLKVYSKYDYAGAAVWIAAYDEGRLADAKQITATLTANETTTIPLTFEHSTGIKIFIWKSDSSMEPICEAWQQ